MTVETTASTQSWDGNGTTGPFPFTLPFTNTSHLYFFRIAADGTVTSEAGVTITEVDGGVNGGAATLTAILAVGQRLFMERVVPLTQGSSFRSQDGYQAGSHENAFDYAMMALQQTQAKIDKALHFPNTSLIDAELPDGEGFVAVQGGAIVLSSGSDSLISAAMLPVVQATTLADARTAFGATTIGETLFTATNAASALSALGGLAAATAASTYAPLASPTFTGDPKSPTPSATDNDTSIATTAFAKVIRGYVNVKDYGAVGDGLTDDTAAIAAAIAVGDTVIFPWTANSYKVTAALALNKPLSLIGFNQDTKIKLAGSMSANLFDISASDVHIERLKIVGDGTQTNALFHFKAASASVARVYIDEVIATDCYRFADDDNSSGTVTSLFINRSQHKQPRERALYLRDAMAYLFVNRFDVDYVGVSAASSNVPAIEIQNNAGSEFTSVNVTGGTIPAMSGRHGFRFVNCAAVWNTLCMADTMGGRGFSYEAVTGLHLDQITASLCDLHGIYLTGCNTVMGQKLYAGGRNGVSGTATQHGLYITGSSDLINITGVNSQSNTGDGVRIDSSSVAGICSLRATSNTGRGYKAAGTASILNGAQFKTNTAGNYDLGGTLDHMIGAQLNSGALVLNQTGSATG